MAKNFDAKLVISTAEMREEFKTARGHVKGLTDSLTALNKVAKESQGNLKATANSIANIVASSRQAAGASKDLAQAKIVESRAAATAQAATDRHALSQANLGLTQARTAQSASQAALAQARHAQVLDRGASAARNASRSQDELGNSLSNSRYLLYDVGATYRTLGIALLALPAASSAVAIAYEKDFAQVIRTTGGVTEHTEELRASLKQLGSEIPLSFSELSNIAMIGGQMDIPTEALSEFTEVVAKFVATADGATIENSTMAFGRLANLFASDLDAKGQVEFFQRIGSAISYTADNSVTSEKKITAMLEKLAATAKQAGLSAQEVTGFASALSSVGLPPEISTGFFTRFFGQMNKDVAAGSDSIKVYNKVLGTTTEEFMEMYNNNPSQVLQDVAKQLSTMDKVSRTSLLGEMGVNATRDQRVLAGLAENYHVLEKAMLDVDSAYNKGTYLNESSAAIFATFAANLQKLGTAFMNLGDSIARNVLPTLTPLITGITWAVQGFSELVENVPALQGLLAVLMNFGAVAGVWLMVKSAQAFVTAGLIGFRHVVQSGVSAQTTFAGQTSSLARTMLTAKGATDAQTTAIIRQLGPLRAIGFAATTSTAQLTAMGRAQVAAAGTGTRLAMASKGVGSAMLGMAGGPAGIAIGAVIALGASWLTTASQAEASAKTIADAFEMSAEGGTEALAKAFANDKVSMFSEGANKFLDFNIGKTYQEVADSIGVSLGDIAKAHAGGSESVAAYRKELEQSAVAAGAARQVGDKVIFAANQAGHAYSVLDGRLGQYEGSLKTTEVASKNMEMANNSMGISAEGVGMDFEGAEAEVVDYAKALNDAVAASFNLIDGQAAVAAALENLGKGVGTSTDFSVGSDGGRSNIANLQASLQAQALLLQQNIEGGKISAQEASATYAAYVDDLMQQLVARGVDPAQIEALVGQTLDGVQGVFNQQALTVPVEVDAEQGLANAYYAVSGIGNWLAENPITADMELAGADETTQTAYNVVQYLSEVTGLPFEAVLTALTDPASSNAQLVASYMMKLMTEPDYVASLNADTRAGVANVQNFAGFVNNQLAALDSAIASTLANYNDAVSMGSTFGIAAHSADLGKLRSQRASIAAPPETVQAKAVNSLIPSYNGLAKAYDKAATAGNKAGGGGRKAADGLGKAGKAAKGAAPAVKDVGDRMKDAAKSADDYAQRLGEAFDNIYNKMHAVGEATDAYYSKLNAIKERREAELKSVRDLRAEIKSLNNERRGELTEAGKLEAMSKVAAKHGNSGRAKDYAEEAKGLRDSAAEKGRKVKANEAEISSIIKGRNEMKGYTNAAIRNREEVRALEKAALAIPKAYASVGASTDTVRRKTMEWTSKVRTHIGQLSGAHRQFGITRANANSYTAAVNRIPRTVRTSVSIQDNTRGAIAGIKKNIGGISGKNLNVGVTPRVNPGAASTANRTLATLTRPRTSTITTKVRVIGQLIASDGKVFNKNSNGTTTFSGLYAKNKGGLAGKGKPGTKGMPGYNNGGLIPGQSPTNPNEDNLMAQVTNGGLIKVRSNEFIQSEPAVKHYGLDFMEKLNKMQLPKFAAGGTPSGRRAASGNSTGLVDLSAQSVNDIANVVANLQVALYADSEKIAETSNRGNDLIAQKGGRGLVR